MKKQILILVLAAITVSLVMVGCGEILTPIPEEPPVREITINPAENDADPVDENLFDPLSDVLSVESLNNLDLNEAEKKVLDKIKELSYNIFHNADQSSQEMFGSEDGTFCISPLSAIFSFALYANSIDEPERERFLQALGLNNLVAFNGLVNKLLGFLPYDCQDSADIKFANSVWYQEGYSLSNDYTKMMADYFAAPTISFLGNDAARVNEWSSLYTNGMIGHILDRIPDNIDAMWINTLMFKNLFARPFDESETSIETFRGTNSASKVYMMNQIYSGEPQTCMFEYGESDGFSMVSIPFKNGYSYKLDLILATEDNMTVNKYSTLDYNTYCHLKSKTRENKSSEYDPVHDIMIHTFYRVSLSFPKFNLSCHNDLTALLKKMNIPMDNAKLTSMGFPDDKSITPHIFQNSVFEVDEYGASAAATTYILGGSGGREIEIIKDVYFNANRPFIFVLTNETTGLILLAGRINNLPNAD